MNQTPRNPFSIHSTAVSPPGAQGAPRPAFGSNSVPPLWRSGALWPRLFQVTSTFSRKRFPTLRGKFQADGEQCLYTESREFWTEHHKSWRDIMDKLRNIDTFLLDLDGTFYLGDHLYPWSLPFVATCERLGKRFIFVTNNSSRKGDYYVEKIRKMGVSITADQVFTAGQATIFYLKKYDYPRKIYLVGTPSLEEEFRQAGFILTEEDPETVVLGFDLTLTYEKLRSACSFIRQGIPFIATHPDFNCPTPEGPIPDCGAMIALITASTGVEPKIIGKPYPEMIEALRAKYGLEDPGKVAMVGDRLYTDIAMGKAAGITSILVLSGETKSDDLAASDVQPDVILDNLGEIAKILNQDSLG